MIMKRVKKKPSPYLSISLPKKSIGGYHTFKTAKDLLEAHGITDVEPSESDYVDHFGIRIKRQYKKKANTLLLAMPVEGYKSALEQLELKHSGQRTAQVLGLSLRQCQRIAAEQAPVPPPVEKLLKIYLSHREIMDEE